MRSDSDLHETRTDGEQSETQADFRVSFESDEWADLDGPRCYRAPRIPYHEHQLRPRADYSGVLDRMDVDGARALFSALVDRFHLHDFLGFPLPPTGLPGFRHDGFEEEDDAGRIIEIGLLYALAVIHNQPRAMHLRWQGAEAHVAIIQNKAKDAAIKERVEIAMREEARKEAAPQFVYFIGSASGAIKIGTTTNPESRLKSIQTGHHERLNILATCDGGLELERSYHSRFADRRLNGEWFERCPEIEAEIGHLTALKQECL